MLRALRFLIIAVILLGLAWGIGSIPGNVTAHSGAYTLQLSVPGAILLLAMVVVLLTLLLRVLGGVRRAPGGIGRRRGQRRRRLGEEATERGIVALAAGDAARAQAEAGTARKLLGDTPLALLLAAESARLAGNDAQANAAFEALTRHKNLAYLGHRGLLRHHLAAGDHELAGSHALAAEDAYPGAAWTREQRLRIALKKRDFAEALRLAGRPAEIAALGSAAAENAAPADALRYAKQALKAAPGFAPAIAAQATALRRLGREKAARQTLSSGWAAAPHPMLAKAWLDPAASAIERARAATELAKSAPNHPESELLLAETAFAAQLTGEAKRHATAAIAAGAKDKRPYSLLASLDPGTETITAAAQAPAPRWHCGSCGADTPNWTALCPACEQVGTLSWKTD